MNAADKLANIDLEMTTDQKITLRTFDRNSKKIEEVDVEYERLISVEKAIRDKDNGHIEQLMQYLESILFD